MLKLKCNECGNVMTEDEATVRVYYGSPEEAYADFEYDYRCSHCGSKEVYPASYCDECELIFFEDQLTDGLCPSCYAMWVEHEKTVEDAREGITAEINMADMAKQILKGDNHEI